MLLSFILFVLFLPELTPEEREALAQEQIIKAEQKAEQDKLDEAKRIEEVQLAEAEKAENERIKEAEKSEQKRLAAQEKLEKEKKAAKEARLKEEAEQQKLEEADLLEEKSRQIIKEQARGVEYESLARNPDTHVGKIVVFQGQVVQVVEDGNDVLFLVDTYFDQNFGYDGDTVYLTYEREDGEMRILEGDLINLYGEYQGLVSYETIWGQQVTIPQIQASFIEMTEWVY